MCSCLIYLKAHEIKISPAFCKCFCFVLVSWTKQQLLNHTRSLAFFTSEVSTISETGSDILNVCSGGLIMESRTPGGPSDRWTLSTQGCDRLLWFPLEHVRVSTFVSCVCRSWLNDAIKQAQGKQSVNHSPVEKYDVLLHSIYLSRDLRLDL